MLNYTEKTVYTPWDVKISSTKSNSVYQVCLECHSLNDSSVCYWNWSQDMVEPFKLVIINSEEEFEAVSRFLDSYRGHCNV